MHLSLRLEFMRRGVGLLVLALLTAGCDGSVTSSVTASTTPAPTPTFIPDAVFRSDAGGIVHFTALGFVGCD